MIRAASWIASPTSPARLSATSPTCTPMRTRTRPSGGHGSRSIRRCASTAPSSAAVADGNVMNSESPSLLCSDPDHPAADVRMIA